MTSASIAAMDKIAHSEHSTLREHIVEHVLVGEILRTLWRRGIYDIEVLRSEFDAHGYDMLLSRGPIVRHIQFKSGPAPKPVGKILIPLALAQKTGGCVIWVQVTLGLDLGPLWFFGGRPIEKMPGIEGYPVARRTTRNKTGERPARAKHREVPASQFNRVDDVPALIERLLGPLD